MQRTCPACGTIYEEDVEVCSVDGFELIEYEGPDPLLDTVLDGRFRIDEVLGEGGMGQVYRAKQLSVDRDVAVKVMRAEYSVDRQIRERFFREARVISGLNHPNIVQLIDFGHDAESKRLFLAMEFLNGVSLRDLLTRGQLRRDVVIALVSQALSGLAEAHANGIVHRDLKPDNLMVVANADGGFQLKVLDFGIAHSAASDKKITTTGAVMGTPHYMAPEQATGRGADNRTDIYSLGAIFYEMLSGRLTFPGESAMQILVKLATETPVPLSTLVASDALNDRLVEVVTSMLARTPDERPQSVNEVNRQLAEITREFDIPAAECAPENDDPFGVWFGSEPEMKIPESEPKSRPVQIQKPIAEPTTEVDAIGHETRGELAELDGANHATRTFFAIAGLFVAVTTVAVWFALVRDQPEPRESAGDPAENAELRAAEPAEVKQPDRNVEEKVEESTPKGEQPVEAQLASGSGDTGLPDNDSKAAENTRPKPSIGDARPDEPKPRKTEEEKPETAPEPTKKPKSDTDEELEKRLKSLDRVVE